MIWDPLYKWLSDAVPGSPVIKRDQDGPKPKVSFVAAKVIAEAREGHPVIGKLRDDGTILIQQGALLTVSVQTFGPEASLLARSIRDSVNKITVQDGLRSNGLAYVDVLSGPTDISEVVGTTWEQRWHVDVLMRTNVEVVDDVGIIERVELTGNFNDGALIYTEIVGVSQ